MYPSSTPRRAVSTPIGLLIGLCLVFGLPAGAQTSSLGFTNSGSEVLSVLSSEGLVGGEQVDEMGAVIGSLTIDTSSSAVYADDRAAQRATLELDGGRDLYRFEGAAECAGLLEVAFKTPAAPTAAVASPPSPVA